MNDFAYEMITTTSLVETSPDFYTGNMNGLLVTVEYISNRGIVEIRFGATDLSEDEMSLVCQAFRDYIDSRRSHLQIDEYSICILLHTEQNWQFRFRRILEIIDSIGFKMDIHSGCYLCGETGDDIRPYEIESLKAFLCPSCAKRTADDLCENLQEKTENSRFTAYATTGISDHEMYFPGTIAALIGALVGMVLFFLLSLIPFGHLLAGVALTFLIFFAYRKYAEIMKVRGLLISLGLLFFFLFFALAITLTPQIVSSVNAVQGAGTLTSGSVFFSFIGYLNHPDAGRSVMTDFVLACFGAAATVTGFIISTARKNNQ
ncbi:MAG: hypothetical protein JW817_04395 [Clostridiales bacterium]|nr:hypothetical protein [Clostridiales bacterium]